MDNIKQVLKTVDTLVSEAKALRDEYAGRVDALNARERNLAIREKAVSEKASKQAEYAPLEDMQNSLNERSAAISQERTELERQKAVFETFVTAEGKALEAKKLAAQEVADQADQVRRDKIALEKEKVEYKDRIKKELVAGLK